MATAAKSAFRKSLEEFKKSAGLTDAELKDFNLTSLDDLKRQIATIQDDQRRSRKQLYLKRLEPFLDAMEQYGKVVEVFLNLHEVVAFVWGPMKFLLIAAKNYTDAFHMLLDGYQEIGESLPQLRQYETMFLGNTYMQLALANIYEDILEFHKEAMRHFRQRRLREIFHATSRAFARTIDHITKDLRRHKDLIEAQASLVMFEKIQDLRTQAHRHFEEDRIAELHRQRRSVQQWLCPLDAQSRQEQAAQSRHGSSGDWFISDGTFQAWFDFDFGSEQLLWLSGIPGAGKTVLASRVIQECQRLPQARTCFFYCRQSDQERSGFLAMARTMLSQLVIHNEALLQLTHEYVSRSTGTMLTSIEEAKSLLSTALVTSERGQKTYIVIDGLDEYCRDDRKEIASWYQEQIQNIPQADLGHLRCLFVSQDDGYARKDLSDCSCIKLTPADTRDDIEAYCRMWHERIEKRFGPLDLETYNITDLVTARAQGMFLYAKLVTWNLHEQPSRQHLLQELDPSVLPDGLDQAYSRIIDKTIGPEVLPRSRRESARRLLGWLTCAKRSFKWREIQGAVSIDMSQDAINPDLHFKDECKDLCASLAECTDDGVVSLVHTTAKQYLLQQRHIVEREAELDLANMSLTYLSLKQFSPRAKPDTIRTFVMKGDYAFADYASCFWAHHLVSGLRGLTIKESRTMDRLILIIELFLDTQWAESPRTLKVSKTLERDLSPLNSEDMFDSICQAVVATKNQLLPTGKAPSDDEPIHVAKTIHAIRTEMEAYFCSSTILPHDKNTFINFYGTNIFKCNRLNCYFYSNGFKTKAQRDSHIAKHERPYPCPEEGCPHAVIGCVTEKDLRNHMISYHGTVLDVDACYPAEDSDVEESTFKDEPAKNFACAVCHKRFSDPTCLRAHSRVHMEKKFFCLTCNKAFARRNDRDRHQGTHGGEKQFVCEGSLKDGSQWGCGRKYHRPDGLQKHWQSNIGKGCRQPLLDEEKGEGEAHEKDTEERMTHDQEHKESDVEDSRNWIATPDDRNLRTLKAFGDSLSEYATDSLRHYRN